ncbi:hypothetical protein [Nissabacter sp. SGAir0207]|uniref:hypothetical protein n=1 Tax=Nissabacter sp. SGAir0207 TaxID=2126321 RepID=UPI0010CCBFD1|nr:hypothetical protein [Nissabacter sp. SGAir0207]QCR38720.1 hypothetical protein C1N62_21525 [Nissabacter sp. SGAir0207]
MLKNTLKMPRANKQTLSIINACDSASEVAQAISSFWGSAGVRGKQNFIETKLLALVQQDSPSDAVIDAFLKLATATMGTSYNTAKKALLPDGTGASFWGFVRSCTDIIGVPGLSLSDDKAWKMFFVNGAAYRLRPAVEARMAATTPQEIDDSIENLKGVLKFMQESNGSLKGSSVALLKNRVGDLLDGELVRIFTLLAPPVEQASVSQDEANAAYQTKKADGVALLSGLNSPADAMVSAAKEYVVNMLDPANGDSLEWLNLKNMFGDKAGVVKDALIQGRFGYGNPQRRDGCRNYSYDASYAASSWLKQFMGYSLSKVTPVIEELRQKLESMDTVSDEAAEEWANGIKISKMLMSEYDAAAGEGAMLRDLAAAFKLAGGRIKTLKQIDLHRKRSYASRSKQSISLNPTGGKRVLWHEIGHHFEYSNPDYLKLALAFLTERAGGSTTAIASLRKFYAGANFDKDEAAIIDNFASPYIGKIYGAKDVHGARATEVFSTAFEYLVGSQAGAVSLVNGDGLLEFAAGILKEVHGI